MKIMDYFIAEKKKLTTDIIVSKFGNLGPNGEVYNKVKTGFAKRIFELGVHGWDHIQYSQLTEQQQKDHFNQANNKLQSLLGTKSRIFGAPYNEFNSATIKAMAGSGLNILSTSYSYESSTTNPYKVSTSYPTANSMIQLSEVNITESLLGQQQYVKKRIYHLPFDISLLSLRDQGYSGDALVQKVISMVDSNTAKYGFSVIVLHPSDVALYNTSTNQWSNSVDSAKFQSTC